MKNKLKKIFKSKIFFFVLGIFVCGTVGVYAATVFPSVDVTYDNKESGLSSTNVQGAIDELYEKCGACTSIGDGKAVSIASTSSGIQYVLTNDGTVYFWNKNYNEFRSFGNIGKPGISIAVSSDGSSIYVLSSDGTVYFWNNNYNEFMQRGYLNETAVSIALVDNTPYVLTSDGTVYFWNYNFNYFYVRGQI